MVGGGVGCPRRGPSFLDTALFVRRGRASLALFLLPCCPNETAAIIKLGDDREEVIRVELVGSREAGCCFPSRPLSLLSSL